MISNHSSQVKHLKQNNTAQLLINLDYTQERISENAMHGLQGTATATPNKQPYKFKNQTHIINTALNCPERANLILTSCANNLGFVPNFQLNANALNHTGFNVYPEQLSNQIERLFQGSKLELDAITVLTAIHTCSIANRSLHRGYLYRSGAKTLAKKCGISTAKLTKLLKILVEHNFITIRKMGCQLNDVIAPTIDNTNGVVLFKDTLADLNLVSSLGAKSFYLAAHFIKRKNLTFKYRNKEYSHLTRQSLLSYERQLATHGLLVKLYQSRQKDSNSRAVATINNYISCSGTTLASKTEVLKKRDLTTLRSVKKTSHPIYIITSLDLYNHLTAINTSNNKNHSNKSSAYPAEKSTNVVVSQNSTKKTHIKSESTELATKLLAQNKIELEPRVINTVAEAVQIFDPGKVNGILNWVCIKGLLNRSSVKNKAGYLWRLIVSYLSKNGSHYNQNFYYRPNRPTGSLANSHISQNKAHTGRKTAAPRQTQEWLESTPYKSREELLVIQREIAQLSVREKMAKLIAMCQ